MVRVAREQEQLRTARVSLASAVGAGALVFTLWAVMTEPPPPVARQRTLTTYPVLWLCEENPEHRFKAKGRFEALPCRECAGRCHIQLRYVCAECGDQFDVFVRFARAPTGGAAPARRPVERVVAYRFKSGTDWLKCDGHVPCPKPGCTGATRPPHTSWSEQIRHRSVPGTTSNPPPEGS